MNLATGIILFCLDADHKGHQWIFYAKLGSVVLAMYVLTAERNYIRSDDFRKGDTAAKARRDTWAPLSLWGIATATGRLMAYVG